MLWLIIGESSHSIISCNMFKQGEQHQVWVERPNGKTMRIIESTDPNEAKTVKDAIDFAIENGHKTLNLNE